MRRKIVSILAIAATTATTLLIAAPAQADIKKNCYGYIGNFMSGTRIDYADWDRDGKTDECFGIAPDRTIWHTWLNAGGWREMPNGGLADNVIGSSSRESGIWPTPAPGQGIRIIDVRVNGAGVFRSTLQVGRGSWQAWQHVNF